MSVIKLNTKKGKASDEDVEFMMKELVDYRDDDKLSKWERAFYDNIKASLDHGRYLTELQILKLREMYEEYCS